MSEAKWQTRVTDRQLSAAWGVTLSTIRNYSSEAHRNLMFDPGEREELRLRLALECEQVKRAALSVPSKVTGQIDVSGAIRAMEFQARVLGLNIDSGTSPDRSAAPQITIVAPDDPPSDVEPGSDGDGGSGPSST
jgi:hypothetical protein